MCVPGPEELRVFVDLLQALLSSETERRQESERVFEATQQQDPDLLCRCLAVLLTQSQDATLRTQSAVLLRQCLKATRADFVWPQVGAETQVFVKSQLLTSLRAEPLEQIRYKVGDAVANLASHLLVPSKEVPSGWPEMREAISELIESQDSRQRESGLRIVKDMLGINPPAVHALVGSQLLRFLQLCHMDTCLQVQTQAVLLYAAALEHLTPTEWEPLLGLTPSIMTVVQHLEPSEGEHFECLKAVTQSAEVSPEAFQQHLEDSTLPMMAATSRAKKLSDRVRQMSFEFLASIAGGAPEMCSKCPGFTKEVVKLCLEFMAEIEDEADWSAQTSTLGSGNVDASNYDVGEENIDRFAKTLGSKEVLELIFSNAREFAHSPNWKCRHAAVATLSQCAQTVEEDEHVDEIVQLSVSLLEDDHPRVRYSALHVLGQTASDHSPYLQERHHQAILPGMMQLMQDPLPRVASHACAAFVNFAEELESEVLLPFVPSLIDTLCPRLAEADLFARGQAVSAIAAIAEVIETELVPYYQQVMPLLKQIVLVATDIEERALRGKAFECMSLMGIAVGREVFQQDAQDAMQVMMETASRGLAPGDPLRASIYEAAQRICLALKEDFLPYLPDLLPGIYAMLETEPTEVVDPEAEGLEDMDLTLAEDGKALGLKHSQVEDFQSAVKMLKCFMQVLGEHYAAHVQETAQVLLRALDFPSRDDVKREALGAWLELLS
ncbi:unnamed protein product, partial [Polarella glacialis]